MNIGSNGAARTQQTHQVSPLSPQPVQGALSHSPVTRVSPHGDSVSYGQRKSAPLITSDMLHVIASHGAGGVKG